MPQLDITHDPGRKSWVPGADGHPEFPIQNLPFCVFSPPDGEPRAGVAIGDAILDLRAVLATGLLTSEAARAAEAARGPTLNELFSLGGPSRRALRTRLSQLLSVVSVETARSKLPFSNCGVRAPSSLSRRRLHRLLCRHSPRDERRKTVSSR